MEINYYAVLVCAVLSMVVGAIWYGPLFGKKWAEVVGVDMSNEEARKEMQKGVGKLYAVQFALALFQIYVLAHYIKGWTEVSGVENALWIWAGFIIPTVAGSAMWNNDSSKISWTRFLIQGGYQLILFIMFGFVLGTWV